MIKELNLHIFHIHFTYNHIFHPQGVSSSERLRCPVLLQTRLLRRVTGSTRRLPPTIRRQLHRPQSESLQPLSSIQRKSCRGYIIYLGIHWYCSTLDYIISWVDYLNFSSVSSVYCYNVKAGEFTRDI